MAMLRIENGALNLRLSRPEKLGALHGDVRVACGRCTAASPP